MADRVAKVFVGQWAMTPATARGAKHDYTNLQQIDGT